MKPVIQQEKTGCGIAACAALAGISYLEAKRIANSLGISADDQSLWSTTAHARRLLSQVGIQATAPETSFTDWHTLPDRALLAIKWHEENGCPFWHWTVFVHDASGAYVLDSKKALKNNVRTYFGRMKPKWFIEILS